MIVRGYGIRGARGVLTSEGELLVDAAAVNKRVWELAAQAESMGARVRKVNKRRLDNLCKGGNHQGVVFVLSGGASRKSPPLNPLPKGGEVGLGPLPKGGEINDIARKCAGETVIALDGVSDPQNLGAIARAAAAFGVARLIMPRAGSAPMNAAAVKVAGAAARRVSVVRVGNLRRALLTLGAAGWRTVAVDERGDAGFFVSPPAPPYCWVFGGEGGGLRRLTRESCDYSARLPSVAGDAGCLNVAAAVAGCLSIQGLFSLPAGK